MHLQWCEDYFSALPNSNGVHELYDDFSSPCYDGEHSLIMGGSFISTGDMASVFARFHFRSHFFQHAGFRVVSGSGPPQMSHQDSPGPHRGSWNPSTTAPSTSTHLQVPFLRARLHVGVWGAFMIEEFAGLSLVGFQLLGLVVV